MNDSMRRARRFLEIMYALAPRCKHTSDLTGSWRDTSTWMRKLIAKSLDQLLEEQNAEENKDAPAPGSGAQLDPQERRAPFELPEVSWPWDSGQE